MRNLKEITIEIIKKCNSNCVYCSSFSNPTDNIELDIKLVKNIVSFAKSKNCQEICLSGGEPLLKLDIIDIIQEIFKKDLSVVIYSSGNANIKKLLLYFENSLQYKKSFKLIFNYPSHLQESFGQIVRSTKFNVTILNKRILSCIEKGLTVETNIVPNRLNISSLFDTFCFLKDLGVKRVSILRLVYQGRAEGRSDLLGINDSQLKNILDSAKSQLCDENFDLRIGVPYSNFSNKILSCSAATTKLIVKWDGKIYPCEAFKEAPNHNLFTLGDLSTDSLEEIWNRIPFNSELKELKANKFYCDTCPAQNLYIHESSNSWSSYIK